MTIAFTIHVKFTCIEHIHLHFTACILNVLHICSFLLSFFLFSVEGIEDLLITLKHLLLDWSKDILNRLLELILDAFWLIWERLLIRCLYVRRLLVEPKLTTLTKTTEANNALIRLESGVDVFMFFQVLLQAELFVAELAFQILFVMLFEVSLKWVFSFKGLLTTQ